MFARSDPFFQLHDIITSGGKLTKKTNYITEYAKQLKQYDNEREICPKCKDTDGTVVFNGECVTCTSCNYILDIEIDEGQEWRFYGASDSKSSDPTRVGRPTNNKYSDNLGTFMNSRNRSQYYNFLRNLNNKWINGNHKDRTLNKIFISMTSHGKRMGLNKNIIELGEQYYHEVNKLHTSRANNRKAQEPSCLYEACRVYGVPRTIKEFADAYKLDKKLMTKGHKRLRDHLKQLENKGIIFNQYIAPTSSTDYIERYCSNIGISKEMVERCLYAMPKMVDKYNIAPKHTPTSIAAGCIFLISMVYDLRITKGQIMKATKGVSKVTVGKCFTTLYANKERLMIDESELEQIIKSKIK